MLPQNCNKSNSLTISLNSGYSATIYPLADGTHYWQLDQNGKFVECGIADDADQAVHAVRDEYTVRRLGEQIAAKDRSFSDSLGWS